MYQCIGEIGRRIDFTEPVTEYRRKLGIVTADVLQKAFGAVDRSHAFKRQEQRQLAARPVLAPGRVGGVRRQCADALTQDRLDRVLPPGFDMERLPEWLPMLQPMPMQPVAELAVALHALL